MDWTLAELVFIPKKKGNGSTYQIHASGPCISIVDWQQGLRMRAVDSIRDIKSLTSKHTRKRSSEVLPSSSLSLALLEMHQSLPNPVGFG